MSSGFKYLIIADESPEFPSALTYAALRAKYTNSGLIMLRVVEPVEPAEWVSVAEEIRRQAAEAAEALTQRFAAEIWAETGLTVEIVIREGDLKAEIRRLADEDKAIKIVILAAGAGQSGPGPLISAIAKGHGIGGRAMPVLIVPGGLNKEEVRLLASPQETAALAN
ncbi:MAG: universal stress protein [Hyphomonadaceae bacterium]